MDANEEIEKLKTIAGLHQKNFELMRGHMEVLRGQVEIHARALLKMTAANVIPAGAPELAALMEFDAAKVSRVEAALKLAVAERTGSEPATLDALDLQSTTFTVDDLTRAIQLVQQLYPAEGSGSN